MTNKELECQKLIERARKQVRERDKLIAQQIGDLPETDLETAMEILTRAIIGRRWLDVAMA